MDPGRRYDKVHQARPGIKRLDCIWDVWDKEGILAEDSYFSTALDDDQKVLIERHNIIVYACFLRSAKIWNELNDDVFRFRKGSRIIHGGLQLASDYMTQGDLSIIPLTSTIGYQANSHVVVHFVDGNPDMGRKVFQPELKKVAEDLAVRAVNTFKKFLQHLKPDTGAQAITPDKELHNWKRTQEDHRDRAPLAFAHKGIRIALVSTPQQEQDVVALFHELIGAKVLSGFRFYGTSQSDRYDSLFFMEYSLWMMYFSKQRINGLGLTGVSICLIRQNQRCSNTNSALTVWSTISRRKRNSQSRSIWLCVGQPVQNSNQNFICNRFSLATKVHHAKYLEAHIKHLPSALRMLPLLSLSSLKTC